MSPLQKKIIIILFSAAFLLIVANIIAGKVYTSHEVYKPAETTGNEINTRFISALKNFGIDTSWVKRNKPGKKDPDSLFAAYSVNVPSDLPIALLLNEIANSYDTSSVKIKALEKKVNGETVLTISSGNMVKLQAAFEYNPEIKRQAGALAFLIDDFSELTVPDDSILLNSPESFAVILTPSKANAALAKTISEASKEYVLELNDGVTELEYKLSPAYSEPRLKNSIRSILGNFGKAVFILVDDNSSLYSSDIYPFIKSEFEKRSITILKRNAFRNFSGDNTGEMLNNYMPGISNDSTAVIVPAQDFMKLNSLIVKYRKIGYKFINPSLAVTSRVGE